MGLEILRNCSAQHLRRLHAIFVPVGGGGMLAGIASYVKAVNPSIKVYGVEPTGADPRDPTSAYFGASGRGCQQSSQSGRARY